MPQPSVHVVTHFSQTLILLFLLFAAAPARAQEADAIYLGGDIVTINEQQPTAESLAVKDGRIVGVGAKNVIEKAHKGTRTKVVDLGGKTLVPGFVDGHSHFTAGLHLSRQANCSIAPAGPVKSIEDIVVALKEHQKKFNVPKHEPIVGYGYEGGRAISDGRELSADDLDPYFPDNPVFIHHVSGHGGVCNSVALKHFNVTKDTPTPTGGVIVRKPGSNEPAGFLMETAWFRVINGLPKTSEEELLNRFDEAQQIYAAAGITTAQDGATRLSDVALLQKAASKGLLYIDVAAFPMINFAQSIFEDNSPETFGKYTSHFKLAGIKVATDGSPQMRTAFFTSPYLTGGPNGESDWRGVPLVKEAQLREIVELVYSKNLQLIVHCNGDAAIDLLLETHEAVAQDRTADRRTTVIHSQFVRMDQLEKYAAYKIIPSFFTQHCFYFADTHLKNRGKEQTSFISPMKTALGLGIRCPNHTDFPVTPVDHMFLAWTAVNRISRAGELIGPDERISPWQALKAVTLDGAYLYREEGSKGSLEVGKLADLVILDKNPLKVDPLTIKDIKVVETIKEGKSIYKKN